MWLLSGWNTEMKVVQRAFHLPLTVVPVHCRSVFFELSLPFLSLWKRVTNSKTKTLSGNHFLSPQPSLQYHCMWKLGDYFSALVLCSCNAIVKKQIALNQLLNILPSHDWNTEILSQFSNKEEKYGSTSRTWHDPLSQPDRVAGTECLCPSIWPSSYFPFTYQWASPTSIQLSQTQWTHWMCEPCLQPCSSQFGGSVTDFKVTPEITELLILNETRHPAEGTSFGSLQISALWSVFKCHDHW